MNKWKLCIILSTLAIALSQTGFAKGYNNSNGHNMAGDSCSQKQCCEPCAQPTNCLPTVCYQPYVQYKCNYYTVPKCEYVPRTCYKKNWTSDTKYYTKTNCRYVPQYYTTTHSYCVPRCYYTTYTCYDKKPYCETRCNYTPSYSYRKCCYPATGQPACPVNGAPVSR